MPEKYGTHERAALLMLMMREDEPVPNTELTAAGIELRPAGRTKLNKAGLLTSWSEKRRLLHEITDEGRDWSQAELARIEAPPRSGPVTRVVCELVRWLVADLNRRGVKLKEVIQPHDLETLIRAAYLDLSVKPQDWVRLAKLRPRLNGADKDEVDGVLLEMVTAGDAHLAPDSNRKVLTDADHAAAIRVGSEDKHLMAIEES